MYPILRNIFFDKKKILFNEMLVKIKNYGNTRFSYNTLKTIFKRYIELNEPKKQLKELFINKKAIKTKIFEINKNSVNKNNIFNYNKFK